MKATRRSSLTVRLLPMLLLVACQTSDQGRWYKGNLHTHTLWSDGNHFPEMVVDWYASRGYDFLALTDHNIVADRDTRQNDATQSNEYIVAHGDSTEHVEARVLTSQHPNAAIVRDKSNATCDRDMIAD